MIGKSTFPNYAVSSVRAIHATLVPLLPSDEALVWGHGVLRGVLCCLLTWRGRRKKCVLGGVCSTCMLSCNNRQQHPQAETYSLQVSGLVFAMILVEGHAIML